MKALKTTGTVDQNGHLQAEVSRKVPPGPVELIVLVPEVDDEDEAGDFWMQGVAREWAAELADPREDIYTLDDGEPLDGRG